MSVKNSGRRAKDPRIVRSQAASLEAARSLFLSKGFAGTTMEEIAGAAGLTKRTLYNNYPDKNALFSRSMNEILAFAGRFAADLHDELAAVTTHEKVGRTLEGLGHRLALGIMRTEVIGLRRLLVAEGREFPRLGAEYFDAVPGRVLATLDAGFQQWKQAGLLRVTDTSRAAAQFAYLVVGEPLDRAMLSGKLPARGQVVACARDGVKTFLARYGTGFIPLSTRRSDPPGARAARRDTSSAPRRR